MGRDGFTAQGTTHSFARVWMSAFVSNSSSSRTSHLSSAAKCLESLKQKTVNVYVKSIRWRHKTATWQGCFCQILMRSLSRFTAAFRLMTRQIGPRCLFEGSYENQYLFKRDQIAFIRNFKDEKNWIELYTTYVAKDSFERVQLSANLERLSKGDR